MVVQAMMGIRGSDLRVNQLLQLLLIANHCYAHGFIFLYWKGLGVPIHLMLVYHTLIWGLALPVALVARFNARLAIRLAFIFQGIFYILALTGTTGWHILVLGGLHALQNILFWAPFLAGIFDTSTRSNRGVRSAGIFSAIALGNVLVPPLGGWVADALGYKVLFITGALSLLFPLWLTRYLDGSREVRVNIRGTVLRPMAPSLAAQGLFQGIYWLSTAIVSPHLLDHAIDLGLLLSLIGIMAALSTYVSGRLSDRMDSRVGLAYLYCVIAGIVVIAGGLSTGLPSWIVVVAAMGFLAHLVESIQIAITSDEGSSDMCEACFFMEWFLYVWRTVGCILVLCLYFLLGGDEPVDHIRPALVLAGVFLLAYPFLIPKDIQRGTEGITKGE